MVADVYVNSNHKVTLFTLNGKVMDAVEGEKFLKGRLREGVKATVNLTSEVALPKVEREMKNQTNSNLTINYKVVPKDDTSGKTGNIRIHIDSEGKLFSSIEGAELKPITPVELMQLISKYKDTESIINLTSDKEMEQMKNLVKEACRKNNQLKINYRVMNK